ncbi:SGNH/GDSL hydrolase family protein [Nocardia mexicana]|uniref:Lysophospholipase L1-like esterase n=1 Tax=Nocardia mexicana TaxID=279262 RepID=A0A370GXX8_9NOCA|nr:SGNH/GDSL hydrolase family protein [Nocardia mexicana]RDI46723.1 lysophospholipase L1-like esterase [Nocardia mexicana]
MRPEGETRVRGTQLKRYVALGDSFTEGVGDDDPAYPNGSRGWADRVAAALARTDPGFEYANLAIRGRLMRGVVDEQLPHALALRPDLVTISAGGNDILRPQVDLDQLVDSYAEMVRALRATGARVLVFTAFDGTWNPIYRMLRGRMAIYNELIREFADDLGAEIVDFWRMGDFADPRLWSWDRLHLSTAGHERMAAAVLEVLGFPDPLHPAPLPSVPPRSDRARRREDLVWAKEFLAPWIMRRIKGTSSGDGLAPKYPAYVRAADIDLLASSSY